MSGFDIKKHNDSFLKKRRFFVPSLTGIRGVAALWVALHHCGSNVLNSFSITAFNTSSLLTNGFRGVDLFFVLSGLILMLTHGDEFREKNTYSVKRFYILRMVRVYPLNTLILLAMVPFVIMEPNFVHWMREYSDPAQSYKAHNLAWPGFLQSLLLVQTWTVLKLGAWNGPSWSLSAEVLGYLFFPVVAWKLMRVTSLPLLHGLAACALAAECVILAGTHHLYDNPSGTMGAVRMAGGFVAGMALGRASAITRERGVAHSSIRITALACAFVVGTLLFPRLSPVMIFGFAWMLFGLSCEESFLSRALGSSFVVWMGKISFPFYLVHFIIFKIFVWSFFPHIEQNGLVVCSVYWLSYLAIIVALACILHQWVERPSHKLAKRLAGPPMTSPARESFGFSAVARGA